MSHENNSPQSRLIADCLQRTEEVKWTESTDNARVKTALLEELIQNHIEIHGDDCPEYFLGATTILSEIRKDIQQVASYCSAADIYISNTQDSFKSEENKLK